VAAIARSTLQTLSHSNENGKEIQRKCKRKTMVYKVALFYTVFSAPPRLFFGESARGPFFGGVRKKAAHLFGLFEKKTFKLTTPVIGAVSAHVCQIINKILFPYRSERFFPVPSQKRLIFENFYFF